MQRARQIRHTERALTLALVLVATGYASGTVPIRDFVFPRPASTGAAPVRQEAAKSGETRITPSCPGERRLDRAANHLDAEQATVTLRVAAAPTVEPIAPQSIPHASVFLSSSTQRGPPAIG